MPLSVWPITPPRRHARAAEAAAPRGCESHVRCAGGLHLTFDGFGCPTARLDDIERTRTLLATLPGRLGMTRLAPPCVFRHPVPGRAGTGMSGFVLVAGNRVAVYARPGVHLLHAEVSSRGPFDVETVLAELKKAYAPRRVDWKLSENAVPGVARAGTLRRSAIGECPVTGAMGLEVLR